MKTLILLFASLAAFGQMLPGPGGNVTATASYTGPLDVTGLGTNVTVCYSLRACSSALRGNNAVNVCDAGDAHCADAATNASTGDLTIPSSNPNCTGGACTVKKIYDQTTGGLCGGTCDLVQNTEASRPVLTLNCYGGSKPCLTWTATKIMVSGNLGSTISQPYSVSTIGERTGGFTNFSDLSANGSSSGNAQIGFANSADTAFIFTGAVGTKAATDSVPHTIMGMFNDTVSVIQVDASASTVTANNRSISQDFCLGNCNNGLAGLSSEIIWWSTDKSGSFSALNTNQHTYFGF